MRLHSSLFYSNRFLIFPVFKLFILIPPTNYYLGFLYFFINFALDFKLHVWG